MSTLPMDSNLLGDGVAAHIVFRNGVKSKTVLRLEMKDNNIKDALLCWRGKEFCVELSFITSISRKEESSAVVMSLEMPDLTLNIEMHGMINGTPTLVLLTVLIEIWRKAQNMGSHELVANQKDVYFQQSNAMKTAIFKSTVQLEETFQLSTTARFKEAVYIMEKVCSNARMSCMEDAVKRWIFFVKETNQANLARDKFRWRLHAVSNENSDLQAWYHGLFFQEVYRLRGHFWYKHAALANYSSNSYDTVGNTLTPMEEAQLAQVLCSPNTSYSDVAGQMFVVQAIVSPEQFALFQHLASHGLEITKYPRQGKPARKQFRFSFVEGNIYLTWIGKFGNQGVSMQEVARVVGGIETDILARSARKEQSNQYLSLICDDRSVDLYFETETDRNTMRDLLETLLQKEKGILNGISSLCPATDSTNLNLEWNLLYSSIGKVK